MSELKLKGTPDGWQWDSGDKVAGPYAKDGNDEAIYAVILQPRVYVLCVYGPHWSGKVVAMNAHGILLQVIPSQAGHQPLSGLAPLAGDQVFLLYGAIAQVYPIASE